MAIGGFLEEFTVSKTKAGIKNLIDLNPTICTLVINYNRKNESEIVVPANLIKVGDIVKVVPGEIVPVDGEIILGESSLDHSVLTGESIPDVELMEDDSMEIESDEDVMDENPRVAKADAQVQKSKSKVFVLRSGEVGCTVITTSYFSFSFYWSLQKLLS